MKATAFTIVSILVVAVLSFTAFTERKSALSPRFNHVMLYVSDLDASIEFYVKALNVSVTGRVNEIRRITEDGESVSNVRMAFLKFPGQDFIFELSERTVEGATASPHFQHLGIDVRDIESASRRFAEAGGKDFSGINHLRANDIEVKNCFFTGPDGEQIELMEVLKGEF